MSNLDTVPYARYAMYKSHADFLTRPSVRDAGRVLELGGSNGILAGMVGLDRVDIAPPYPDVDIMDLKNYRTDQYDLVLLDEVLEHVQDPNRALAEVLRVLRPGGWMVTSSPFLVSIHRCPEDYWRFAPEGLRTLLRSFIDVEIRAWGNRQAVILLLDDMMISTARARSSGMFDLSNDSKYPVTVWAYARKPEIVPRVI